MTNVHEHNDITVSIKVQQFRSRRAKSVYYNRTRVVCECHGYTHDREPSRVPVRMLKRLSQKIRILQSRDKHGKKYLKYLRFFLCNFPYSEYKGVIHRGNCTKNKLYN
ncbi:hypothetical protein pdam_00020877 [Pocillopora damicornis]|uniref:Uncharacterized protein n=1 Tax=Pocillopora damicornis TaxID=46731 RepID=A0A3M6UXZ4_POCDA|nr:hypothetical protein pdam_00020877 [Pocillopora damicornis]